MTARNDSSLLARWNLAKAASTDGRLSRASLATLIAILDRLNGESGEAWPSARQIALDTLLHESTVKNCVSQLAAYDYLLRASGGVGVSNRYRIGNPPTRSQLATSRRKATRAGSQMATKVVANRRPTGVANRLPEHADKNLLIEPTELNPLSGSRFNEFWLAYPKKVAKPQAEKAWKAGKRDQALAEILADLAARMAHGGPWKAAAQRYIPNPATYLNGERWKDEWQRSPAQPGALAKETRTQAEIDAENDLAIQRMGGGR